jgi:hypothetical protein
VQTFGFLPNYRKSAHRGGLMNLAGVPNNVPGGVLECLAVPRDPLGRAIQQVRPLHVWVFLLLDHDGRVEDYRFLSFGQVREFERHSLSP